MSGLCLDAGALLAFERGERAIVGRLARAGALGLPHIEFVASAARLESVMARVRRRVAPRHPPHDSRTSPDPDELRHAAPHDVRRSVRLSNSARSLWISAPNCSFSVRISAFICSSSF